MPMVVYFAGAFTICFILFHFERSITLLKCIFLMLLAKAIAVMFMIKICYIRKKLNDWRRALRWQLNISSSDCFNIRRKSDTI